MGIQEVGVGGAQPVFLFGTLRDAALRACVLGRTVEGIPAHLSGHRVARASGAAFPVLTVADGSAEGILVSGLNADEIARLDYFEAPYGYIRQPVEVVADGTPIAAEVYRPTDGADIAPGEDWSLAYWQQSHGPLIREAAKEIMESMITTSAEVIAQRQPVILARAQQRLNAACHPSPTRLRMPHDRSDISEIARQNSYSHFFALDDLTLSFKRFDGQPSSPVDRAVFVAGDAVTVLPYDPVLDQVMLIEQFRAGTYLRGDPNPWSLEAIAGRQDPGESLEDTARREAQEEAGITLNALHKASSYYVSPGCNTEYLTSFIGIADLSQVAEGIGGLESEAEDIRSLIVPFARLMAAIDDGEAENAPLVLSALWLAANRAKFCG